MGQPADRKSRSMRGDNRRDDIRRSAEQLQTRTKFLRDNAGEAAPYRPRLLAAAAVSELSDGAFRVLAIRSIYANPDGTSCTVSQKTIAHLLCKSLSTIERADNELKGWAGRKARGNEIKFISVKQRQPKANSQSQSALVTIIRDADLNRVIAELCGSDPSSVTGLNISDPAQMTGLNISEPSSVTFRTRTDDGQPCSSYPVVVEEKELHTRARAHELDDLEKEVCRKEPAEPPSVEDVLERVAVPSSANGEAWTAVTEHDGDRWRELLDTWGYDAGQRAQIPSDRHTAHGKLKAAVAEHGRSFDSAVVTQAMASTLDHMETLQQDRANGVRSEKERKGAAACRNYFEKAFKGRLGEFDRAHRQRLVDSAVMAEKARITVEGDRRASTMKTDSLGKRLTAGEAANANRLSASGAGKTSSGGSSDRFPPDGIAETVHGCVVKGDHANRLIEKIPGATRSIVSEALVDASGVAAKTFGADEYKKANIKPLLEWCERRIRRTIAYATHGEPEKLAGGTAARVHQYPLATESCAVSEAFVEALQQKYPDAWTAEREKIEYYNGHVDYQSPQTGPDKIEEAFFSVTKDLFDDRRPHALMMYESNFKVRKWNFEDYGRESQQRLEDAFSEKVAALDAEAKKVRAANTEFDERKAHETEDDLRGQEIELERRNRDSGLIWTGSYYTPSDEIADAIWRLAAMNRSEIRRILLTIQNSAPRTLEPYEMREKLDEEINEILFERAKADGRQAAF